MQQSEDNGNEKKNEDTAKVGEDSKIESILKKKSKSEATKNDDSDKQSDDSNDDEQDIEKTDEDSRLKIDPNYRWLLKDLKLSEQKRVIDVTDLLASRDRELNEEAVEKAEKVTAEKSFDENQDRIDSSQKRVDVSYNNDDEEQFNIRKLYENLIQVEQPEGENNDNDNDDDDDDIGNQVFINCLVYRDKVAIK